jgi:pimeloyl-ACP methyl ester carboxylesterase
MITLLLIPSIQLVILYGQTGESLPVILIHGYRQNGASWNLWEQLLERDGIPYFTAEFEDGECGSSEDHANELKSFIDQVKGVTGYDKVNLVGFSKGGLDARVYLEDGGEDVQNLIMIGTPNAGAPLSYWDVICLPAADDLQFGSDATEAAYNPNTTYFTIYGNWFYYYWGVPIYGHPLIPGSDDGLVPVWSVNSQVYFHNIGRTFDPHLYLQTENEYDLAYPILSGE